MISLNNVYIFCQHISESNSIYVGLTPTTRSRRLTMQLLDISSIAQHLKKKFLPKNRVSENSYRKQNNIRTIN